MSDNDLVHFNIVGPVDTAPFKMITRWMHGDADGYTEETELFSTEQDLLIGYRWTKALGSLPRDLDNEGDYAAICMQR